MFVLLLTTCVIPSGVLPQKARSSLSAIFPQTARNNLKWIEFIKNLGFLDAITKKYIALDTEATGIGQHQKLMDVGCYHINFDDRTAQQFQSLINPGCEVSYVPHKLTGYTWGFLRKYGKSFHEIAENFLKFIEGSCLVIHNAHLDLKLINAALEEMKHPYGTLEKHHQIIDTNDLAQQLGFKKHSLEALCHRYGIDLTERERHGALIDAKLLAQVFSHMFSEILTLQKEDISEINGTKILERFQQLKGTEGGLRFSESMGIKQELLPDSFYYKADLYHPHIRKSYPAILVAFTNSKGEVVGIYTYSSIPDEDLRKAFKYEKEIVYKKKFYGQPQGSLALFYKGTEHTVFLGNINSALIANDILQNPNNKVLRHKLGLDKGFSIKAYLDIAYLSTVNLSPDTKRVIILVNNDGRPVKEFYNHFRDAIDHLFDPPGGQPKVKVDLVTLRKNMFEQVPLPLEYKDNHDTVREQLVKVKPIQKIVNLPQWYWADPKASEWDDLRTFVEKNNLEVEEASTLYEKAESVEIHRTILEKQGSTKFLPKSFRYLSDAYHPHLRMNLPAILVPFYRDKKMMAIYRWFCRKHENPQVSFFEKSNLLPLGDMAGTITNICKINILLNKKNCIINEDDDDDDDDHTNPKVVILSKKLKDSLTIRNTLLNAIENTEDANKILDFYNKLGDSFDMLEIKHIPQYDFRHVDLGRSIRTVVVISEDNGGDSDSAEAMKVLLDKQYAVKLIPNFNGKGNHDQILHQMTKLIPIDLDLILKLSKEHHPRQERKTTDLDKAYREVLSFTKPMKSSKRT